MIVASSVGAQSHVPQYNSRFEIPSGSLRTADNPNLHPIDNRHHTAMKTTSGTPYSDWFDYWNQNYVSGTSNLYSFITYPDSNLYDNTTGTTPYYVYCHGMGMSFDPTDNYYYASAATSGIADPPISTTQAYTVDSFRFPYEYVRNYTSGSGTDSLIVELFVTTPTTASRYDSGMYLLKLGPSPSFLPITADSAPRFATPLYTGTASALGESECWDSITAQKQRYAFPLVISGTGIIYTTMNMRLSSPLVVPAGQKVVSYVHFKSANSFSLGTNLSAANYLVLFGGSTAGVSTWPQQPAHNTATGYPGSYQTGLIAHNIVRYHTFGGYSYLGHDILVPGVGFTSPILAVTQQAFHVNWNYFPAITGTTTLCSGDTATLHNVTTGGTWASSTPTVATINSASGLLTALSAGTAVITYTAGTGSITTTVTVNPLPTNPVITGPSIVCKGSTVTLASGTTGGTWSSANTAIAIVNTSGVVRGITFGTTVISYTKTNTCGSVFDTASITVDCATGTPIVSLASEQLEVLPNPNDGSFVINLNSAEMGTATVNITNITGQTVYTCDITAASGTGKSQPIDLQQPAGIYFIAADLNGRRFISKMVVAR